MSVGCTLGRADCWLIAVRCWYTRAFQNSVSVVFFFKMCSCLSCTLLHHLIPSQCTEYLCTRSYWCWLLSSVLALCIWRAGATWASCICHIPSALLDLESSHTHSAKVTFCSHIHQIRKCINPFDTHRHKKAKYCCCPPLAKSIAIHREQLTVTLSAAMFWNFGLRV